MTKTHVDELKEWLRWQASKPNLVAGKTLKYINELEKENTELLARLNAPCKGCGL